MTIPPIVIDMLCDAHLGEAVGRDDSRLVLELLGLVFGVGFASTIGFLALLHRHARKPARLRHPAVMTTFYVLLLPVQVLLPLLLVTLTLNTGNHVTTAVRLLAIVLMVTLGWLNYRHLRILMRLWTGDDAHPTPRPADQRQP